MNQPTTLTQLCLPLVTIAIFAGSAFADLVPSEIAILANGSSRESKALAKYYAEQRSVPLSNICVVDMPQNEVLQGSDWHTSIRPSIRKWLSEANRAKTIRCFVTVWHVPLKIAGIPDPMRDERVRFLRTQRQIRFKKVKDLLPQIAALAPEEYERLRQIEIEKQKTNSESGEGSPAEPEKSDIEQLRAELQQAINRAQTALMLVDDAARAKARAEIEKIVSLMAGESAIVNSMASVVNDNSPTNVIKHFNKLLGRMSLFAESRLLVEAQPYTPNRDILSLDLVSRHVGLLGSIEWIDQHLEFLKIAQTSSSLDSELSLVLWREYATTRWQSNYLNKNFAASSLSDNYPTMMVSRIDAPTLKRAKALIDTAIEVENTGLQGNVYLDARGLSVDPKKKNLETGSYEQYDRAVVHAEEVLEATTNLLVTLDRNPALFQPGDCKNAALYCGWYSVAKYVDAFDWNKGAVAYHLASSEASTLKKPESEVWCKKLLEDGDGVCATIGPVYEPYLIAFPQPDEFFPELLSGKTLVESYFATKSFNSWMMVLIGDPLYRPYKDRKALKKN
ncbi:MAG: TIGR03790 family protein [Planctomycetota bacterium]